jgi:DNA polymerase-3 subunit beta
MIGQVVFAAATDESRPVLTGVLTVFENDRLTMAAADGYRLAVQSVALDQAVDNKTEVIIPARALAELARVSADQTDPIRVVMTPTRNQILFHMRDVDLVSQLIEGRFPDYQQIIPASCTNRAVVDVAALLKATRVAHLFARDSANIVRFEIAAGVDATPGHVKVAATSTEMGDNEGELDATVDGEPIEIAFNAKYLIEVLSVIGSAQVALDTMSPSSPGVLRRLGDDTFLHVIMPMHLSR